MSKHKLEADADVSAAKQDRKRRKKERKEASKTQEAKIPVNGSGGSNISSADKQTIAAREPQQQTAQVHGGHDEDDEATYKQSAELTTLPQTEVDAYLKSERVQISDPRETGLRPILQFSQLPAQIVSPFASVFSTFAKPSSIQSSAWPFLLSGRDVVGVAETGSGKTLGFGLPLVVRLANLKKKKGIRAVVVAPTRELAIQVYEQIAVVCQASPQKLKAVCIYGGTNKDEQRRSLTGANVVVATPGRLKDFMSDGTVDVSKTRYLVLDEADRMLDKGFEDDIKQIVSAMPSSSKRQTAMFTATWPRSIRDLAATFMKSPVKITIGRDIDEDGQENEGELRANPRIKQNVEVLDGMDKQQRLLQLLKQHTAGNKSKDRILVFCLYKKEAQRIEAFIRTRGFNVAGIHGDMSQSARIESLTSFKAGKVNLLVATDVAARGLDIPNVRLVINVTFPLTAEDYVHRIGRTGRAGNDGTAITFFTEHDKALSGALVNVLRSAKQDVPEDLLKFGGTVKKKQHDAYGAFFRAEDEGKTATKITFDD